MWSLSSPYLRQNYIIDWFSLTLQFFKGKELVYANFIKFMFIAYHNFNASRNGNC